MICGRGLANRVQLTSDGNCAYLEAVEGAFGGDVDYAQLVKLYGAAAESMKGRYSPAECIGARKERIEGNPDPKHISRSLPNGAGTAPTAFCEGAWSSCASIGIEARRAG